MAKSLHDRMSEIPEDERRNLDKILRSKGYGDEIQQSRNKRRKPPKTIKKSTTPPGIGDSPMPGITQKTTSVSVTAVSRRIVPRSASRPAPVKRKKKKTSRSTFAVMNILFILKLLRVIRLRKVCFSPRFMKKFDIEYTEAMRIIRMQLEIIEGKVQDIESLMGRMGCRDITVMQALIDLMFLYDDEFINRFVDKYYENPDKSIESWESDVLQLYSELYAIYPFRNEIRDLLKSMINHMATYSAGTGENPYIAAKDVDVYFRIIFEMLYMPLHWLFCYYLGIKLDTEDPEIPKHIQSMFSKLKKTARKKRNVSSVKAGTESAKKSNPPEKKEAAEVKTVHEESPDSLDDIEGIDHSEDQKISASLKDDAVPVPDGNGEISLEADNHAIDFLRDKGTGYFIRCYNTPSRIMGETTGLYEINHRTDRGLHISFIFKKFVEQFSFIFITNKIKYSDNEMEHKMHGFYNGISRLESSMVNYFGIVESWFDTYNKEIKTKGKNYVSSSVRIDTMERQRQNTGNILRKDILRYLTGIRGTISIIIREIEKNSDAVTNSAAVVRFDEKIEKDKIVNTHSIYESFVIINAFIEIFVKEIEPPGSLSGAISARDEIPTLADPVKVRKEREKELLDKAEKERADRKKAEEERIEAERKEKERAELEYAEKEREKLRREELGRIEKEKAEMARAARRISELERVARERDEIEMEKAREAENEQKKNEVKKENKGDVEKVNITGRRQTANKQPDAGGHDDKNKAVSGLNTAAAREDANPVNSINHAELWQKAVREKIVMEDRAVSGYIDLGKNVVKETPLLHDMAVGSTYIKPSDARNSAYSSGFKPYLNYQYQDVVRRVMEFEIILTDFIRDVLASRYGERWQTIIARNNKEIKEMLDRENELVKHRGIEYNILEMLNIGQKFNIILNDLLWGDFKIALGLDRNDKSEKTIFQKRSTQIINLRNDVMHLKTVDSTKKDIGLGAISELSDCIKKYGFRKQDVSAGSANDRL